MKNIRSNILKIGTLFLIITALVMGLAVPALAAVSSGTAPAAAPSIHTVQGKVISIAASSFAVEAGIQASVTINVDQSTKYYQISMGKAQADVNTTIAQDNRQAQRVGKPLPTRANDLKNAHIPANWRDNLGWLETFETATKFTDIQVGDRVIARTTNDGNNLAKQIIIIKAPVIQQIKGTITAVSANSITITPTSGTAVTVNLDAKSRVTLTGLILVQNGQYAVVTYNHNTMVAQLVNVRAAGPITAPSTPTTTPPPTTTPAASHNGNSG